MEIPRGIIVSYVDDFSITVASPSYRSNIRTLQSHFASLQRKASPLGIGFSVPKTELIHWRTPRDRNPTCLLPVCLNGAIFRPSSEVRWLGYWLSPSMETSSHFHRRLALAWASFALIKRLGPAGKGLSPWCCRKLAVGLLFPILTFGADLFRPNSTILRKLDSFWHAVLRWITNCFRSTPKAVLYCEASLPSISLLLDQKRNLATVRLLCSPPHVNPAAARLHPTVPTWDPWRTKSHRHLLRSLTGTYRPRIWSSPASSGRRHLPLDSLSFSLKDILPDRLPLAFPHLILPRPYDPPGSVSYSSLKGSVRNILLTQWTASSLDLQGYPFAPSHSPHAFMGLPKFMAGRIHQMRSGKSYLALHRSWSDRDEPTLCPSCEEEDESFDHAILRCPAKAQVRESLLLGISDLGPDAPVWSSVPLIMRLSNYISKTATGFPLTMPPLGSSGLLPASPSSSTDPEVGPLRSSPHA